jgi:hypothetical protein
MATILGDVTLIDSGDAVTTASDTAIAARSIAVVAGCVYQRVSGTRRRRRTGAAITANSGCMCAKQAS